MFNFGGMLTGAEIEKQIKKGNIFIDPYREEQINPNSYNLTLHPQLLVYDRGGENADKIPHNEEVTTISTNQGIPIQDHHQSSIKSNDIKNPLDMRTPNDTIELCIPEKGLILQPGVLYIGRTVENTSSDKFIPMINGRSSCGRLGISIHVCAGFGDIGFDGTWTLEITVVEPVKIYPYTEIAQVCYFKPYGKVKNLYRGRYFKQTDATASRFYIK